MLECSRGVSITQDPPKVRKTEIEELSPLTHTMSRVERVTGVLTQKRLGLVDDFASRTEQHFVWLAELEVPSHSFRPPCLSLEISELVSLCSTDPGLKSRAHAPPAPIYRLIAPPGMPGISPRAVLRLSSPSSAMRRPR